MDIWEVRRLKKAFWSETKMLPLLDRMVLICLLVAADKNGLLPEGPLTHLFAAWHPPSEWAECLKAVNELRAAGLLVDAILYGQLRLYLPRASELVEPPEGV